ncbi:ABC transporter permease [Candidatus Saccharibacteria bacterium]|nr:ABC transporter permease [Candidatus Saccharibacteria bacterium]
MKFLDLLKTANHNLLRNKTRTILTILAIFIGSFCITTTSASQAGISSFLDDQSAAFGGEGLIQMYAKSDDGNGIAAMSSFSSYTGTPKKYTGGDKNEQGLTAITPEQIEKVKELPGIIKDSVLDGKFSTVTYVESTKNHEKFAPSLNLMTNDSVHFDMLAGKMIDNKSDESQVVLPNEEWATELGYKDADEALGKTLDFVWSDPVTKELITFPAKIVGVQAPSVVSGGAMVINTALNAKLYEENTKYLPAEEKDKVYTIAAEFDYKKYSADDIKAELDKLDLTGITLNDIMGQIKSFFDAVIGIFTIFGYIALLAAVIGIVNTLLMSVQERTREIGLMKSLGMGRGKIFLSFAIEAVLLGFWGSALGAGASILLGTWLNSVAHQGDGFLQNFPSFNIVEYTPATVIPVIITIMVIAFVASVLPARKASKKDPITALRYE